MSLNLTTVYLVSDKGTRYQHFIFTIASRIVIEFIFEEKKTVAQVGINQLYIDIENIFGEGAQRSFIREDYA